MHDIEKNQPVCENSHDSLQGEVRHNSQGIQLVWDHLTETNLDNEDMILCIQLLPLKITKAHPTHPRVKITAIPAVHTWCKLQKEKQKIKETGADFYSTDTMTK
jgi:hypothetical protein